MTWRLREIRMVNLKDSVYLNLCFSTFLSQCNNILVLHFPLPPIHYCVLYFISKKKIWQDCHGHATGPVMLPWLLGPVTDPAIPVSVLCRGHQYVRTNVSVASLALVRGKFYPDFVVAHHHYGLILFTKAG